MKRAHDTLSERQPRSQRPPFQLSRHLGSRYWCFPARPRYNVMMIEPVARVRIKLRRVRPTVWRRVDVPILYTLAELHDIIQVVMGWRNSHLHEFKIDGVSFAAPDPAGDPGDGETGDARSIALKTVVDRGYRRFEYLYDFGDGWEHEVIVEDVRDGEAGIDYPGFVGGARRCPPGERGRSPGVQAFPGSDARSGPRGALRDDPVVRQGLRSGRYR